MLWVKKVHIHIISIQMSYFLTLCPQRKLLVDIDPLCHSQSLSVLHPSKFDWILGEPRSLFHHSYLMSSASSFGLEMEVQKQTAGIWTTVGAVIMPLLNESCSRYSQSNELLPHLDVGVSGRREYYLHLFFLIYSTDHHLLPSAPHSHISTPSTFPGNENWLANEWKWTNNPLRATSFSSYRSTIKLLHFLTQLNFGNWRF